MANTAPKMEFLGIKDIGARAVDTPPEARPTHYPIVFGYAKTGPAGIKSVSGGARNVLYSADSFDEEGKYVTSQCILGNRIQTAGNAHFFWRIIPKDAGPKSTIRLSLDLLPTMVPEFERMPDGAWKLDDDGLRIPTGEVISGFMGKWISEQVPDEDFGTGAQSQGTQQDTSGNDSIRYPIMDLEVPHYGEDGNNAGLRMWTKTSNSADPLDIRLMENGNFYPFNIACLKRIDGNTTGQLVTNLSGGTSVQMSFKPGAKDKNTRTNMYVGEDFIGNYRNLDSTIPDYGTFGQLHMYQQYADAVLKSIYGTETPYVDSNSDITGTDVDTEMYRINLLGAQNSNGTPYHSFILNYTGQDVVRMSQNSTFWAKGGSDGTMTETLFGEGIKECMAEFLDQNSPLMDMGKFPISTVYDAGHALDVKYALMNVLALRKDIWVALTTYDIQGTKLTAAEESSIAVALRTRANLYPESTFYGTSVARAIIVGRNGRMLGTPYKGRLPLILEIAEKSANYMGSSDGIWKSQYSFDHGDLARVRNFTDVNITWTPETVRNRDWDNGLIWVQHSTERELFFPALRTVYADDTSPLNSYFNMCGAVEMIKVGFRAWTQFVGSDKLTNSEFKREMENYISQDVKGRFDNRFIIIPTVFFTKLDQQRGSSWSYNIRILGANMKVLGSLTVELGRREDAEVSV